jgi:hypothetical protein
VAKEPRTEVERRVAREEFVGGLRRVLAYDQAIAHLQEAGLSDTFVKAIEKDPELVAAIDKLTPSLGLAASPGWSCCVTVSNPLRRPGEEVVLPVAERGLESPGA